MHWKKRKRCLEISDHFKEESYTDGREKLQIRFCDPDRQTKRRKIHTHEPPHRAEDRDHVQQTADNEKPDPDLYTDEKGQIVFLDTPGIHKAKNKLGEYMVNVAERTLNEVDVILWLVEPSTFIGAGERHIVDQLKKQRHRSS